MGDLMNIPHRLMTIPEIRDYLKEIEIPIRDYHRSLPDFRIYQHELEEYGVESRIVAIVVV